MSSREDARLAAESVTRQCYLQAWFVYAFAARDETEGYVVELLVRQPINLTTPRVRGVRIVPVVHQRHPGAEALEKALLAGAAKGSPSR